MSLAEEPSIQIFLAVLLPNFCAGFFLLVLTAQANNLSFPPFDNNFFFEENKKNPVFVSREALHRYQESFDESSLDTSPAKYPSVSDKKTRITVASV